jgi:hypothetical protein
MRKPPTTKTISIPSCPRHTWIYNKHHIQHYGRKNNDSDGDLLLLSDLETTGGELAGREWIAKDSFGHTVVTWGSLSERVEGLLAALFTSLNKDMLARIMIPYTNAFAAAAAEGKSEDESGQRAKMETGNDANNSERRGDGNDIQFAVAVVDTMITDTGRPYLFAVHEGKSFFHQEEARGLGKSTSSTSGQWSPFADELYSELDNPFAARGR